MAGYLIHVAGPMMSFGAQSHFGTRDTHDVPTRSALIGMMAAALGRSRGEDLADLRQFSFTVRTDRPGEQGIDFQTAGGGLPRSRTVPDAQGKYKPQGKGAVLTWRHYLADAAFTIAVEGPDELLEQTRSALMWPRWALFVGRSAFPVTGRLPVTEIIEDPVGKLATFPIHRPRPRYEDSVQLVYVHDQAPASGAEPHGTLQSDPRSFDSLSREYAARDEYRTYVDHPASDCVGYGLSWLNAVAAQAA